MSAERGYRPWSPRRKTQGVLDHAREVFDQYEAQRPLTIRQVFYRLVAAYDYAKTEAAYECLCNYLDRARRARMIPFDWIRDDAIRGRDGGEVLSEPYDSEAWLQAFLARQRWGWLGYITPRSTGQSRRVELWCEAAGMHGQLQDVASRYGWATFSGGGAESLTARYQLVERCARQPDLPTVVLHVGDHDPSGHDIFGSIREDVTAFLAEDAPGAEVEFVRVAVLPEQVTADTPSQPPKEHPNKGHQTRLARWYADGYGETYQAEALPPSRLIEIVDAALRDHTDLDVLADVERHDEESRAWLRDEFEERFGNSEEA